jgi:hypothetical protein
VSTLVTQRHRVKAKENQDFVGQPPPTECIRSLHVSPGRKTSRFETAVVFRILHLVDVDRLLLQDHADLAYPLGISQLRIQCRTQEHP